MVSKQVVPVIGLNLTVYGLEEYKQLPKGTPVCIMFALHGRLQKQELMEHISETLCELNNKRQNDNAHLIVITFDSPNHGSRMVNRLSNFGWKEGKHENPNHAVDMWTSVYSTSRTVSELIDIVEHYLFGPQPKSIVRQWGVMGFSMGGHASFLTAANDPRISVAIPIVGSADYIGLMKNRLNDNGLPEEIHFPQYFSNNVYEKYKGLDEKLKSKHILIINGEQDEVVKPEYNNAIIQSLRKIHVGKEGHDWNYYLVPDCGHEWRPEIIEATVNWTNQWLLKNHPKNESKI